MRAASFSRATTAARLPEAGIAAEFVQDNHSRSVRGVLRGLHYQIEHAQGKLVRVDLRRGLRRRGRPAAEFARLRALGGRDAVRREPSHAVGAAGLRARIPRRIATPPSFSTRPPTTGIREFERTLLWNDPALGIDWPCDARRRRSPPRTSAATPLARADALRVTRPLDPADRRRRASSASSSRARWRRSATCVALIAR